MSDYETFVKQIEKIEKETFADAWSLKSIEETLQQNYNIAFMLLCDTEDHFEIVIYKTDEKHNEISQDKYSLAGYLLSSQVAGESELLRVAIKTEYQGRKLGNVLMDEYLRYISNDCEKAFLEVRESNIKARTMYEKHGYTELAKRKNYYTNPTEDGIVYEYIPNNAK